MTIIEQVKAEIERRKSLLIQHSKLTYDLILETFIKEYDDFLSFLSTLESEKPMNPDDAMKELDEKIALVKERGTWKGVDVDSYMDEVRERVSDDLEEAVDNYIAPIENDEGLDYINFNGRDIKDAFIAGAKWDRQQMLKDAVEVIVEDWNPDPEPEITIPLNPEEFTRGDKVRIIIVKEDEK